MEGMTILPGIDDYPGKAETCSSRSPASAGSRTAPTFPARSTPV
jgi:hypothetical protein